MMYTAENINPKDYEIITNTTFGRFEGWYLGNNRGLKLIFNEGKDLECEYFPHSYKYRSASSQCCLFLCAVTAIGGMAMAGTSTESAPELVPIGIIMAIVGAIGFVALCKNRPRLSELDEQKQNFEYKFREQIANELNRLYPHGVGSPNRPFSSSGIPTHFNLPKNQNSDLKQPLLNSNKDDVMSWRLEIEHLKNISELNKFKKF